MEKDTNFKFIGRIEKVCLSEFGLIDINAKVDTGAYSVAIHAHDAYVDGEELVFTLLDPEHPKFESSIIRTKRFTTKSIKSSNGEVQVRYAILTTLKVGEKEFRIRATLSDRSSMKYPILLGRKFLSDNYFVVDVNSAFVQRRKRKKK